MDQPLVTSDLGRTASGASSDSAAGRVSSRIRGLDGLRGIAVLVVVIFHFFPDALPGGFVGVSVFFTLSGFLISRLICRSLDDSRSGQIRARSFYADFYARRVRRLVPAITVTLVFVVAIVAWQGSWVQRRLAGWDIVAAATSWSNLRQLAMERNYFADFRGSDPLVHFWSLAIEEQFYLVLPTTLFLIAKSERARRLATGAFAALAMMGWAWQYRLSADQSVAYLRTDARVAEMLVGVVIGVASAGWGPSLTSVLPRRRFLNGAALAGLGAVLVMSVVGGESASWLYPFGFIAISLATAALILVCLAASAVAVRGRFPVVDLLDVRPLVRLGELSFAIYLFHVPIKFAVVALLGGGAESGSAGGGLGGFFASNGAIAAISIAVTLGLALVSERFLEHPIRSDPRRLMHCFPLISGLACTVLIALVALSTPFLRIGPAALRTAPMGFDDDGSVSDSVSLAEPVQAPEPPPVPITAIEFVTFDTSAPVAQAIVTQTTLPTTVVDTACRSVADCPGAGLIWLATARPDSTALIVDLTSVPTEAETIQALLGGLDVSAFPAAVRRLASEHNVTFITRREWMEDANFLLRMSPDPEPTAEFVFSWIASWLQNSVLTGSVDTGEFAPDASAAVSYADASLRAATTVNASRRLIVVFGDSVAINLGYSLIRNGPDLGDFRPMAVAESGCGAWAIMNGQCDNLFEALRAAEPGDGSVALVSVSRADVRAVQAGESWDDVLAAVTDLDAKLNDLGFTVAWMNMPCLTGANPPVSAEQWVELQKRFNAHLATLTSQVIDVDSLLCGPEAPTELDGAPLRPDGIHFGPAGAKWLMDQVIPQLIG